MKKLTFIFFGLFSLNSYSSDMKNDYLCTIEASTGFIYEQGKWNISQFSEKDFLIRKLRENDPGFNTKDRTPYAVFELNEKIPAMFCSIEKTIALCTGLGQLEFSSRTNRFIRTNTFDYLSAEEDDVIKPRIMRGSCKPLPADFKEPIKVDRVQY